MKSLTIVLEGYRISIKSCLLLILIHLVIAICPEKAVSQQSLSDHSETNKELKLYAEKLWLSIDKERLKNEIAVEARIPKKDIELFFRYVSPQWEKDRVIFYRKALSGELNASNLNSYLAALKSSYISSYASFVAVREQFAREIAEIGNTVLDASGKCVNMDFEEGSFHGWQGEIQSRGGLNGTGPKTKIPGFGQHCIMTKTQKDPYIPNLSVVAPGGNYSVRLGNTEAGGHMARMTQSFKVDSANTILTYRYAVVLETPENDPNHQGLDSPHFKSKLYDKDGNEISCGEYTVSVLGSNLSSYTHVCVNADSKMVDLTDNVGCGNTTTLPATGVTSPNAFNQCPNNRMDLYYRNWTTVAIALNDYVGQTVTVEFVASDCEPGGHLGYAYIDTECASFTQEKGQTICSLKETKVLTAPSGFKTYQWGPAGSFIGPANAPSVTIDRAGTYTLKLTTMSDNPCVITLNYVVKDKCTPRTYTAELCETVKGSGKATDVNLANYAAKVTENGSWGTTQSWHLNRPVTSNSYIIANPGSTSISNGDVLYAISTLPPRKDTVSITFTINSIPDIVFPDISNVCVGSPAFVIAGVTPVGGTFSGTNVNATGQFNPAAAGTFNVKYEYTNAKTCKNNITKPIVVDPKPTVAAGPDQTLCENATSINLSGTITNATGGTWKGGASGLHSTSGLISSYTPNKTDIDAGSVLFTFTSSGSGACPPASDQLLVSFEKLPIANAGNPKTLCENAPLVTLNGNVTNAPAGTWVGGIGTFQPDRKTFNATYIPDASEITSGSVSLSLRTEGQVKCPANESKVTYSFEKLPAIDPGMGSLLCENATKIELKGKVTNATGILWSGGNGSFNDKKSLTPVYSIKSGETSGGSLTLSVTSTGNVYCPAATEQVTYTFEKLPSVNAGTGLTLCENNPVIHLAGTSSNSPGVVWQGGTSSAYNSNVSLNTDYNPTASEIEAGSITFELNSTGTKVCPADKSTVVYKFEKLPSVDAGNDVGVCSNNVAISLAGVVKNASGAKWSAGKGTYQPSDTDLKIGYVPTQEEIKSGQIELILSTTGALVCPETSDKVKIIISPAPIVDAGPDDTVCVSSPAVTLSGISSTNNAVWSNGGGSYSSGNTSLNNQYTPSSGELLAGKALLILSSENNGNCLPVKDTMEIRIVPLPKAELGDPLVTCSGSTVTIQTGNVPGVIFQWKEGSSNFPGSSNSISFNAKSGKETYAVTLTDKYNCSATDIIDVTGILPPVVSLHDTAVCEGNIVLLDSKPTNINTSVTAAPVFKWIKDGTAISGNNSPVLSVDKTGLYKVVASIGLCSGEAQAHINVHPLPSPELPEKVKQCFETSNSLELNGGAGNTYLWLPSNETSQKITVNRAGKYSVRITNEFNCSAEDEIEVKDVCPPRLFISNSFSPNDDSINDLYNVFGAHIGNFRMLIFNRWGEVIFESKDRYVFWDGFYKGEPMVDGVYPWTIIYEGDSEEYRGPYTMTGSVTVVR